MKLQELETREEQEVFFRELQEQAPDVWLQLVLSQQDEQGRQALIARIREQNVVVYWEACLRQADDESGRRR